MVRSWERPVAEVRRRVAVDLANQLDEERRLMGDDPVMPRSFTFASSGLQSPSASKSSSIRSLSAFATLP